jgi:uncharacterized protein
MVLKKNNQGYIWWITVNALLFVYIGFQYLHFKPLSDLWVDHAMYLLSPWAHMPLFALVLGLLLYPFYLLLPKNGFGFIFLALCMSTMGILLLADLFVFEQYRFHLNLIFIKMAFDRQVMALSWQMWGLIVTLVGVMVIAETGLLYCLQQLNLARLRLIPKLCTLIYVAFLLPFHGIHAYQKAHNVLPVIVYKAYLPFFSGLSASTLIERYGWIDQAYLEQNIVNKVDVKHVSTMVYPRERLTFKPVQHPKHIFIIMIDAWRFDTFNSTYMPHLTKWTEAGVKFDHHYASGNRTWAGVSGFFFSLTGNYLNHIENEQRSPVLIDRLLAANYQMGIFGSAHLNMPPLAQTVFRHVPNLRIESQGQSAHARDLSLTEDWLTWIDEQDVNQPIFSFAFYDAPHSMSVPENYPHQFKPLDTFVNYMNLNPSTDVEPILNRYRTAAHYADSLIERMFKKLAAKDLLKDSIVIVTGDHGIEWNDLGLNYWRYGSNFGSYQIKVPFVWIAPDADQLNVNQITSHHDVVPTLMEHYLGATSPIASYGIGMNLFDPMPREFVLSSGVYHHGLVYQDKVIELRQDGSYHVYDNNYQEIEIDVNYQDILKGLDLLSRFNNNESTQP